MDRAQRLGAGLTPASQVWGSSLIGRVGGTGAIVWPRFDVTPGAWYSYRANALLFATAGAVYVDLIFYRADGSIARDGNQTPAGPDFDFTDDPALLDRIACEDQAPFDAVSAEARFVYVNLPANSLAGVRQMQVERGRLPLGPYRSSEGNDRESYAGIVEAREAIASDRNSLASYKQDVTARFGDANARIDATNTAVANNDLAATQKTDKLRSDLNGLGSEVSTQAGTLATIGGRVRAYWSVQAVAGDDVASVTVFADNGAGGVRSGVRLGGNVYVDGNLMLNGTLQTAGLAPNAVTATSEMSAGGFLGRAFQLTHQPRSSESTLEVGISGVVDVPGGGSIRALANLYIGGSLVASGVRLGKNNQSNTYALTRLWPGSASPVTVRLETAQDGVSQDGAGTVDCTIIIKELKR